MLSIREAETAREQVQAILAFFETHQPDVANQVVFVDGDPERPQPKVRKGIDEWRVRLLPRERAPVKFWHPNWCFYEIIAGELGPHFRSPERVAVQFLQASGQKVCGAGAYSKRVEEIVTEFAKNNPRFRVVPIDDENRYVKLIRAYEFFDASCAAADLAHVIRSTLPNFRSLQGSGG